MQDEPIILGEEAFAAISAVEGIQLSAESQAQLAVWRKAGLSNDEIRARILAQYRGRKAV